MIETEHVFAFGCGPMHNGVRRWLARAVSAGRSASCGGSDVSILDAIGDRAMAGLDRKHVGALADERGLAALVGMAGSGASSGRDQRQ